MKREKKTAIQTLLILLTGFAISRWVSVSQVEKIPLCLFHWMTGFDCPGCGLTRSILSLSQGNWIDAIRFNALGPLVYLLFVAYGVRAFGILAGFPKEKFTISLPPRSLSARLFFLLFWMQWLLKLGTGFMEKWGAGYSFSFESFFHSSLI